MIKYCIGCGIKLQCEEPFEDGYVNPKNFDEVVMCKRCFRLKHYGEYKVTNKSNSYYKNIIKDIFKMNELVLHIVDLFNMGNMEYIYSKIYSPCILLISKIDCIPKSVNKDKIIEYFRNKYPKYKEIILISSEKNYNIDLALDKINKYKNGKNVYVLGNTNAGKSTFINKMIKNYTENNNFIVTSYMPSTTLNVISIKINDDLTLLDTPGLLNDGDINNYINEDIVKKIGVKQEINPRIYQIKEKTSLLIDDIGRINVLNESNISIYISNNVTIDKISYINNEKFLNLESIKIKVKKDCDLVIEGLCFIKCLSDTYFEVYMPGKVDIYTRDKLI